MSVECSKCKVQKPVGSFGRDSRKKNGLKSQCHDCHRLGTEESRFNKKVGICGTCKQKKPDSE